jgi:hypothetical protein
MNALAPSPAKETNPLGWTAAQIATALARKPQSVRRQLQDVSPSGTKIVNGNEAAVFALAMLPENLRQQVEDTARKGNYRNTETLLSLQRQKWEPAFPLDKIADEQIKAATKLREALRPALTGQHDPYATRAEMELRGVEDYNRVFGNRITTRYWRELFMRTIRRDNGAEDWNRLEIYLPDRLKQKETLASMISEALADDFEELEQFIHACSNPHAPNETEGNGIWTLALEKFGSLVNAGTPKKSAARQVRKFLFSRASFLAASRDALLKAFNRKLESFEKSNGDAKALSDGRVNNGDRFQLPEDERDLLIHRAVFYYRGDLSPAWRDCLASGFSEVTKNRYLGQAASKSHVPASVRDSVGPEVDILTVMYQGPRAFDAIKGHVTRSYDGISSLQCISGDDFTLNTYFYVPDGKDWFQLTRGQVILFIDFRSLRILGWALEPRKSYSSLTIRSLCTHVFGEFGVPGILYFERGLWKSATLIKGKTDPFDFTEISRGLREFGVKFIHAVRPRTKVVERIGGMFQDIAEAEPGYCGRDERRDAPETLRPQMAEVEARKTHPSKYFYSLDDWNRRIGELVDRYNSEIQQGHILAGLSPEQGFEKFMNRNDPPMQFSAGLRYLLAHDKRQARVTLNGVTIQIGKKKFNYRGPEIAHLVGRKVLAWFDPENTETITVTNLDRTNPICVALSEHPSALECLVEPDSGRLGRELSRIEKQASHMKTRFNIVKAKFPLPQRKMLADAQAVALGEEINRGRIQFDETKNRKRKDHDRAQRLTRQTGIVVPESAEKNVQPEDAKFLADFLSAENKDKGQSKKNGSVIYQLKPFGSPQAQYVDYLLNRLTEFRKAGASYGQKLGNVTVGVTRKIAQAQLKCDLHELAKFDEICAHLKFKIDGTILGKRNHAQGAGNYHEFEDHFEKEDSI